MITVPSPRSQTMRTDELGEAEIAGVAASLSAKQRAALMDDDFGSIRLKYCLGSVTKGLIEAGALRPRPIHENLDRRLTPRGKALKAHLQRAQGER